MAKSASSDESPGSEGMISSPESEKGTPKTLSTERESFLFVQIKAGAAASEELTERVNRVLQQHISKCGRSHVATKRVREAIEDCIRRAISHQALVPTGHVEFCKALAKGMRRTIEDALHDQDFGVERAAIDWVKRVCEERSIQAVVGSGLWELDKLWDMLAKRESAIQEVIAGHLPLVKSIAKTKKRHPGEYDDLVQESILIVRRLIEKFDPGVGVRFCAYAKQVLLRDLRRQFESRMGPSRHSSDQAKAVDRAERRLIQQRSRSVTTDEVYEVLGHSAETRREIENVRRLLLAERSSSPQGPEMQRLLMAPGWAEELALEEREFRQKILLPAFRSLPGLEKRLVVAIAIRGRSISELAKRYHRNHTTIKRLYQEAMKMLAERIGPDWLPRKPR